MTDRCCQHNRDAKQPAETVDERSSGGGAFGSFDALSQTASFAARDLVIEQGMNCGCPAAHISKPLEKFGGWYFSSTALGESLILGTRHIRAIVNRAH